MYMYAYLHVESLMIRTVRKIISTTSKPLLYLYIFGLLWQRAWSLFNICVFYDTSQYKGVKINPLISIYGHERKHL